MRHYSRLDRLLTETQHALDVLCNQTSHPPARPNPAEAYPESQALSPAERAHIAALMRVNHTGEICAQALYRGQALFVRSPSTREHLHQAAREEHDHLLWCQARLITLDAHTSWLNGFWYSASFKIGVIASLLGDDWSEGFVLETERQVESHLDQHLKDIPSQDLKTLAILKKMREDEILHGDAAHARGARPLPRWVRALMRAQSKVMTRLAYWI